MSEIRETVLRYFGKQLARYRKDARYTQEKLSKEVYCAASLISMIENGLAVPQLEFAQRCDKVLNTGGRLAEIVEDLIPMELAEEWFREWLDFEIRATVLKTYQPLLVPGLCQTTDYMRAVIRSGPYLTDEEVEEQVSARLARQEILYRKKPPQFVVLLDEVSPRRPIGGPRVMQEQLSHLLKLAEHPNIHIQVIPVDTGMYEGLRGPFVLAELGGLGEAVYLDTALRGVVIDKPAEVAQMRTIWEALRAEGLPQKQTVLFMRKTVEEWKQ
jgi:transcriptional regulator with XRE-family HTH domain